MGVARENFIIVIAAIVAVLLQVMLSPYIAINGAVPNIIAAYVMVIAVVRKMSDRVIVLAFILGLCYNLFQGGPVGGMAFALTAVAFVIGRAMVALDNDTAFMPIVLTAVGLLVSELLYGIILVALGIMTNFGAVLVLRVLPCTVYDIVIGLIWYFFMSRIAAEPKADIPPIDGPTLIR